MAGDATPLVEPVPWAASAAPTGLAFVRPTAAARWLPSLASLEASGLGELVVGSSDPQTVEELATAGFPAQLLPDAAALVAAHVPPPGGAVVLATDPVEVEPGFANAAASLVEADPRVAVVSFLCNDAGHLSFPRPGEPTHVAPRGRDLADGPDPTQHLVAAARFVPVPLPAGRLYLLSATALRLLGPLAAPPSRRPEAGVADLALRAQRRGFLSVLDIGTFVFRPVDLAEDPLRSHPFTGLAPEDDQWLSRQHPGVDVLARAEHHRTESPHRLAIRAKAAHLAGAEVVIDGTMLGPTEMGTQVGAVALLSALAERPEVARLTVCLPGPVPAYAEQLFGLPNVRPIVVREGDPTGVGHFDLAYRPLQPDQTFPLAQWWLAADRLVVEVLDLIAYRNPSYQRDHEVWLRYREGLLDAVAAADAVVVISDDVAGQLASEAFPIEGDRLAVIPNGTDHLTGHEPAVVPALLAASLGDGAPFALCLGTDYSHKQRDLAIGTVAELRRRGWPLTLVLAGPSVPFGSSRVAETIALRSAAPLLRDALVVLPDVSGPERNWLLRHASVVLYPTAAEGFGLVPFEAAVFGTPTVHVPAGPLASVLPDLPVTAVDWDPPALADAAERLLSDPGIAAAQVSAVRRSGLGYTWRDNVDRLVSVFEATLARPRRRRDPPGPPDASGRAPATVDRTGGGR